MNIVSVGLLGRMLLNGPALLSVTLLGAAPRAGAQHVLTADSRTTARAPGVEDLLARAITLQLDDVSVKQAVDRIAASAAIKIGYQSDLPALVSKQVSVRAKGQSLGTVLESVLAGTNLRIVVTGTDVLALKAVDRATQQSGTVTGRVRNGKTNQPIAGATVAIDDARGGVATDNDGTFRIAAMPGTHSVVVRAVGYAKRSQAVTVESGQSVTVNVELEPSTSVLHEVIVTGTVAATERKAIPTPITVITADDIEKRGITRVEQLFRGEIPGLLAAEQGSRVFSDSVGAMASVQLFSRGSSDLNGASNPIKTYVDGIELLDPSYLGTLDPKSIERIEIITGPQAATIYGSGAMGGVMQIFTKRGSGRTTPEFTLGLRYGVLQSNLDEGKTPTHIHSLSMSGGTGPQFSYSGNVTYNYMGQWQPGLFNQSYGTSAGMSHAQGPFQLSGSVGVTAGRNGTMPTSGNNGVYYTPWYRKQAAEGLVSYGGAFTSDASFMTQRISKSSSQTLGMNLDYRPFATWQHHLTVGKSQNVFDIIPEAPRFTSTTDTLFGYNGSSGARNTLGYNMTIQPSRLGVLSSTMTIGMNGSWGSQTVINGCLPSSAAATYIPCNSYTDVTVTKTLNSDSWGGFGTWQIGVLDQLFFTFGLRGERNPAYGREHKIDWTPTNGITYSLELGELTVKALASYGRATRPPTESMRLPVLENLTGYDISQYYYQLEAPNLRPQAESGPQGGIEIYYGNRGSLTVNHYRQDVRDHLQSVFVDSILITQLSTGVVNTVRQYQYQNVGLVRKMGWESTASLNAGPFTVRGTYSWNDSRLMRSSTTAYGSGVLFVNGTPTHFGNVTLSYARGGTSLTLVNNVVGSSLRNYTVGSQLATSAYQNSGRSGRLKMYAYRVGSFPSPVSQRGYTKSDLAASQRLNPWTSFTLNVTNLGNSFGSETGIANPALGRQTTMGVSLRFPNR